MRKFLLVAIVAVLLIAVFTVSAWAAGTPSATLTADVSEAHRGDVIKVTVALQDATSVASIGVMLNDQYYDTTVLEWVKAESRWLINGQLQSIDPGLGTALCKPDKDPAGNDPDITGDVLVLAFRVKEGASFGSTTIKAVVKIGKVNLSVTAATVNIVCNHSFTEKVDDTYRKEPATCEKPAEYWKSCLTCGEASDQEFFPYGNTEPHDYGKNAVIEAQKEPATCTSQAVYYETCNDCGKRNENATFESGDTLPHDDGENVKPELLKDGATCTTQAVYYKSCNVCGHKNENETFLHGDMLPHDDGENVKPELLKDKATCTTQAVYYKSCNVCGEKNENETFKTGEALGHDWSDTLTSDTDNHWYACNRCTERKGETAHAYDQSSATKEFEKAPATCTTYAVYHYSCVCGVKGTETFNGTEYADHVYGNNVKEENLVSGATCTAAAVYKKSCNACGVVSGTETFASGTSLGHTGGTATCTQRAVCTRCEQPYGSTLPHTYNKEVQIAAYKKNDASCTERLTYYKSCVCGDKGTATFTVGTTLPHSYVEKVATTSYLCTAASCEQPATYYTSCTCGAKGSETFESGNALGHSYTAAWQKDENGHWYECTTCHTRKDEAAHVAGPEATEEADQICTVCEFIITPSLGHEHSYSTDWSTSAGEHWHACACGDKKDVAAHTFEHDCDTTCDVCSYTREVTHAYGDEWVADENGHWYACETCGSKKNEATHTAGPEATEEAAQTCTVCGYVLAAQLTHQHAFGEEWQTDGTSHWHACACGEQSDLAQHTWNAGEVTAEPTTEAEGTKTYTCTTCGETKTEQLDKLPPKADDNTGMIIAIVSASVVVAAGATGAAVFVLKKRKK